MGKVIYRRHLVQYRTLKLYVDNGLRLWAQGRQMYTDSYKTRAKKRTIGSSLKEEKREKVLDERQEAYRRTTPFIFFMRLVFLLSPGDMLGFLVPCPSSKYPVAGSALSGVAPDGGKVGRSLLV